MTALNTGPGLDRPVKTTLAPTNPRTHLKKYRNYLNRVPFKGSTKATIRAIIRIYYGLLNNL